MFKKPCHAFTLVELLVVIGIIALIVSMLLPALTKARRSAETLSCAARMRQVGLAWQMYINDNNGWMVPSSRKLYGNTGTNFGTYYDDSSDAFINPVDYSMYLTKYARWYNYLVEGYLKNYEIVNCPTLNNSYCEWTNTSGLNYASSFGSNTAAVNSNFMVGTSTVRRGQSRGLLSSAGNASPVWRCNYAYPMSTFGTSEESNNPIYINDLCRIKKRSGLMAFHQNKQAPSNGITSALSPQFNNIIVLAEGSASFDYEAKTSSVAGGKIYAPYRWLHNRSGNKQGQMNVLCIDGRVTTVNYGDIFYSGSKTPGQNATLGGSRYAYIYYIN